MRLLEKGKLQKLLKKKIYSKVTSTTILFFVIKQRNDV